MVRVLEPVDSDVFNLGEALVTHCELSLDGEPGWALVLGDDPERALCAAVLDANARRGLEDWVEAQVNVLLESVREARRERWRRVQHTRVEFEQVSS